MVKQQIDKKFDDFLREWEFLGEHEQRYWQGYERTIITLSSAMVAASLAFLGLLARSPTAGKLNCRATLILSWVLFGVAIVSTLSATVVNGFGFRREINVLRDRLAGKSEPPGNVWSTASFVLYAVAGTAFLVGLILLLVFCGCNLQRI